MTQEIRRAIRAFKNRKVIVWGDIILDEYTYTSSNRVSREAPVLITEFDSSRFLLGGAGNVLMNIKTLGGIPVPVGFVGGNETGERIRGVLRQEDIRTDGILSLEGFESPRKTRIMAGGEHTKKQQVLRIDRIFRGAIPAGAYRRLERILSELISESPLLLISDYLQQSVTGSAYRRVKSKFPGKGYLVDSREHFNQFHGASYITPNEPEIKRLFVQPAATRNMDYLQMGRHLIRRLDLDGVVLKRGQEGMMVILKDRDPVVISIHGGRDIVDVTGAGDTVLAVLGLGMMAGLEVLDAARLANTAAGLVVMREGAYALPQDQLIDACR